MRCSTANGWNEQNRIERLGPYLSGHALILYNTLRDDQKQNWADLRTNLLALFYPPESRTARNIEFQAIQYVAGESIDIYAYRLERSFDQANPDYVNHPNIRTELLKSQFIKGLPEPFHTRLLESPLLTYDQCKTTARQLLAASKLSIQPIQYTFSGPCYLLPAPIAINAFRPLYTRPNEYDPDNSYYYQKSCPRGSVLRCFNCGSTQPFEFTIATSLQQKSSVKHEPHDSTRVANAVRHLRRIVAIVEIRSSGRRVDFSNNHLVMRNPTKSTALKEKLTACLEPSLLYSTPDPTPTS